MRLHWLYCCALVGVCACGAKAGDGESEGGGGGEGGSSESSTTAGPGSGVTSGPSESGGPGESDEATATTSGGGDPIDCEDRVIIEDCAAGNQVPPPGALTQCVWIDVMPVEASPDTCGFGPTGGRCISATYQGDGCGISQECGDEAGGQVFYRELSPGDYEFFRDASLCEYYPDGWDQCFWDENALLTSGDFACNCLCD